MGTYLQPNKMVDSNGKYFSQPNRGPAPIEPPPKLPPPVSPSPSPKAYLATNSAWRAPPTCLLPPCRPPLGAVLNSLLSQLIRWTSWLWCCWWGWGRGWRWWRSCWWRSCIWRLIMVVFAGDHREKFGPGSFSRRLVGEVDQFAAK